MANDLKLNKGGLDDGSSWTCPSCGEKMPHGAVICIACGFDKRSGRRVQFKGAGPSIGRIIGIAVGLGLIGFAIYIFLGKMNARNGSLVAAGQHPAGTNAAARESGRPAATSIVGLVSSSTNAATEFVDVEPGEAMTVEARDALTKRIDQRFPPYATGESVALRMTNGIIRRGLFNGLQGSNILITVGAEVAALPLGSLDIASRLRVDPDYRVRYVDYWSQRGLKTGAGP